MLLVGIPLNQEAADHRAGPVVKRHEQRQLALSVRTLAQRFGCSKDTAGRSLNELEEKGFIEPTKISTFRRKDRLATEYRLTNYRDDVAGVLPTKAFMSW